MTRPRRLLCSHRQPPSEAAFLTEARREIAMEQNDKWALPLRNSEVQVERTGSGASIMLVPGLPVSRVRECVRQHHRRSGWYCGRR